MNPDIYRIIHVLSLFGLVGSIFYGFAGAPSSRKKVMILGGIAALLALVSGFGLVAKAYGNNFSLPWIWVKFVAWLALGGLMGIGYRKRDKAPLFMTIILAIVGVALWAVFYMRTHG